MKLVFIFIILAFQEFNTYIGYLNQAPGSESRTLVDLYPSKAVGLLPMCRVPNSGLYNSAILPKTRNIYNDYIDSLPRFEQQKRGQNSPAALFGFQMP
jgi:hypothetical protein